MDTWKWAAEIGGVGLGIAILIVWIYYYKCCSKRNNTRTIPSSSRSQVQPRPSPTFEHEFDDDEDGVYNNATVLTPPRLQLYRAYRSSSSIDISSASLDPHAPSSVRSETSRLDNAFPLPYIVGGSDEEDDGNSNGNGSSSGMATATEILSRLPEVVVNEEKSNLPGGMDKKECSICLGEYESGDKIKVLACMHSYHENCVATWICHNAVCPLCKLPL